jgi:hypothetical protein
MRPTRQSTGSTDAGPRSAPGSPTAQSAQSAQSLGPSWRSLWLPLSTPGPVWLATSLLAVIYLATMSRDLSFYDSAELALATVQGGLSHPPGHPLYMMLGWLFTHVPGVSPLVALNALSAIPAALALVPVASLAESMAGPPPGGVRGRLARYALPALLVILALHAALWEVASRIEVYALAAFFALWAVARAAAMLAGPIAGSERAVRWLAPGLTLGLSASVNPVIAVLAAVSLAPALIAALVRRRARWTHGLVLVAGGLAGCLPYLYVPLVAGRRDVFVWGAPTGGEALWRFLTLAEFSHNRYSSLPIIGQHAVEWVPWAAGHGLLPLLALGLVAHMLWGRLAGLGRMYMPLSLGLTLLFIWRTSIYHPDIADYLGYLMVPLSLLGAGVGGLFARLARLGEGRARLRALAGLLACALLLDVVLAAPSFFGRTRHRDDAARMLAHGALERAPRDAVLIVASDHWVFPIMYLQEVEGVRPDVVVLARGLSGASWFWQHLFDLHRELRPFELRGPGGQPARIDRFLAANPGRPVLYENWEQALALAHRPVCAGAWLLGDERACSASARADDALTPALERALDTLGRGAPTTDAVIAKIALDRGELLWRLGQTDAALRALRAGVPPAHRPPMGRGSLASVTPLRDPLPAWRDGVTIGHYAQNLYLAALLLGQAGIEEGVRSHLEAAAEAGLAEALAR